MSLPSDSATPRLSQEQILDAMKRLHQGDLTAQLPLCDDPTDNETAQIFNAHVHQMNQLAGELTYLSRDIGTQGRLGGQIEVPGAVGTWRDLVVNVNTMSVSLTNNLRAMFHHITRIANADFSQDVSAKMNGELLEAEQVLTALSDQLAALHRELIRLAEAQLREHKPD
ncbi:MAG: hypothetical protein H8F28_18730 [Fibrella sp.]|nr:hypothetical protein [Armatimonadota bacterium]